MIIQDYIINPSAPARWKYTTGTSLRGYIRTTFQELKNVLGEPILSSNEKVLAEWVVVDPEGTVATIYIYKETTIPEGEYPWHIGGKGYQSVDLVEALFPEAVVWEESYQ